MTKQFEYLEPRVLFDADPFETLSPIDTGAQSTLITTVAGQTAPGGSWLTPAAVRTFYGINGISFSNGSTVGNGNSQTIAIIMWGHDPNIANDLATFDAEYALPAGTLTVYAQSQLDGQFYNANNIAPAYLPPNAAQYNSDQEIALDVEWAHASAPSAQIVLVEAMDNQTVNVGAAINYAKSLPGVSAVSMSFTVDDTEAPFADSTFSQAGVTFLAATGDYGSYNNPLNFTFPPRNVSGVGIGGTSDTLAGAEGLGTYNNDFFAVTQVQAGTTASQAGLSIRSGDDGTATNVANVSLMVRPGTTGIFEYRSTTGGVTTVISNTFAAPVGAYLGILRQGNTYYGYTSNDGVNWTFINGIAIAAMNGDVTIDCVGASGGTTTATAAFGHTTVYGGKTTANAPATSANVIGVGGTVVTTTSGTGGPLTITNESSAWGNGTYSFLPAYLGGSGAGGGYSSFETSHAFQNGYNANIDRSVADVALSAGTNVSIYDSDNTSPGWDAVIGTSFATPVWAGLMAIADQGRYILGLPNLSSPDALAAIYSLPSTDFNDIQTGSIGDYSATTGYDLPTGRGTPHAPGVVGDLSTWISYTRTSANNITISQANGTLTVSDGASNTRYPLAGANGLTLDMGNSNGTITLSGVTANSDFPEGVHIQGSGTLALAISGSTIALGNDIGFAAPHLSLHVESGGQATMVSNQTLQAITVDSGGTLTSSVALPVGPTDNGLIAFNPSGALTISTAVSGSGGVNVSAGTVVLTAANSYFGGTTVSGGMLRIANSLALGNGSVTVLSGASLDLNGQAISGLNLTLNGGGSGSAGALTNSSISTPASWSGPITLNTNTSIDGAGSTTLSGMISGGGALTKFGTGVDILAGVSIYFGGTTVSGGTLRVANSSALGLGSVTVNSGTLEFAANAAVGTVTGAGTVQIDNGVVLTATGDVMVNNVADGGTLVLSSADSQTVSALVSGNGALQQVGAGTATLTAANNYMGGTSISGYLYVDDAGLGNGNVVNNGVLELVTANVMALNNNISGAGFLYADGNGTITLGGAYNSTGELQVGSEAGGYAVTLKFTGSVSMTGTIIWVSTGYSLEFDGAMNISGNLISEGNTIIRSAGTDYLTGSLYGNGNIYYYGGVLYYSGYLSVAHFTLETGTMVIGSSTVAGQLQNNGTVEFAAQNSVSSPVTGSGTLRLAGGAAVELSTSQTLASLTGNGTLIADGGTTVVIGSLVANNGDSLALAGGGTIDVGGSQVLGGSSLSIGTGMSGSFDLGNVTVDGGSTLTVQSGVMANSLAITDGSQVTVDGASLTVAGQLVNSTGSGQISVGGVSGDASTLMVQNGATVVSDYLTIAGDGTATVDRSVLLVNQSTDMNGDNATLQLISDPTDYFYNSTYGASVGEFWGGHTMTLEGASATIAGDGYFGADMVIASGGVVNLMPGIVAATMSATPNPLGTLFITGVDGMSGVPSPFYRYTDGGTIDLSGASAINLFINGYASDNPYAAYSTQAQSGAPFLTSLMFLDADWSLNISTANPMTVTVVNTQVYSGFAPGTILPVITSAGWANVFTPNSGMSAATAIDPTAGMVDLNSVWQINSEWMVESTGATYVQGWAEPFAPGVNLVAGS